VSAGYVAGLGVLLTGIGSLISAIAGMRIQRKRSKDECAERIEEFQKALKMGMNLQDREDFERWSHLP